jgi:hypothetical protein
MTQLKKLPLRTNHAKEQEHNHKGYWEGKQIHFHLLHLINDMTVLIISHRIR